MPPVSIREKILCMAAGDSASVLVKSEPTGLRLSSAHESISALALIATGRGKRPVMNFFGASAHFA